MTAPGQRLEPSIKMGQKLDARPIFLDTGNMLERFSERAKKVMLLADQAAVRCNSETIGTEHLLCGILKESASVASCLLHELDVDFKAVRAELDKHMQKRPEGEEPQRVTQSVHVKKVIEDAIVEARHLNHPLVGTEHLLLGILRESDSVAGRVLTRFGLTLDDLRDRVRTVLDEL